MPRKTKETNEEIIESKSKTAKKAAKEKKGTTVSKSKTTAKKATAKKETKVKSEKATKKAVKDEVKKATKKVAKVEDKPAKKSTATKVAPTSKKATTEKKATAKKSTAAAKKTTTKAKTTAKKTSTKTTSKSASKAKTTTKTKTAGTKTRKSKVVAPSIVEYYDLPYKYNQTVVKVLYQNPSTLFVYWEISDNDIENYKATYGENFFETTKPVLVVHNDTMNYKFEIDINDFANCWYFNINDSKCNYRIELIRKPISYNEKIKTEYIYITSSNKIESPNDKILFSTNEPYTVYFRNVKNNNLRKVNLPRLLEQLNLVNKNFGFPIVRNVYDLYTNVYHIEDAGEHSISLTNPSSGNPSSHSFATRFI